MDAWEDCGPHTLVRMTGHLPRQLVIGPIQGLAGRHSSSPLPITPFCTKSIIPNYNQLRCILPPCL